MTRPPVFAGAASTEAMVCVARPAPASKPELGERRPVDGLGLRRHHPLEARIARLGDTGRHRHEGGHRAGDPLGARGRLAFGAKLRPFHIERGGERDARQAEQLGDGDRKGPRVPVGRFDGREHHVDGSERAHGGGEHPGGHERVGAAQDVIGHEHPARGTHRETAPHRGHGYLGAHRHEHDLAAVAFHELQRALEPVLVARVERTIGALANQQMVLAETGCALWLGNPLDQHGDVHRPMLAVARLDPQETGATVGHVYLDDIEVGLELVSEPRTITGADIEAFATLTGDHNPLHLDPASVADSSPYDAPIAHGLLITSISSGQTTDADDWALGIYLEESRRFVAPVFADDAIRTVTTVTDARRSRSKPDRGVVTMRVQVLNQRDELVQEGTDIVLVGARP